MPGEPSAPQIPMAQRSSPILLSASDLVPMPVAQQLGCPADRPELGRGRLGGVHRALGEGPEAAIGVEEDLLGVEELKELLDKALDGLGVLDLVGAGVRYAEADLPLVAVLLEDIDLARPWRRHLEHELIDVHPHQVRQERPVVPRQQHLLAPALVATADVHADAVVVDTADGLVDQVESELQLVGRIAAGGQRGAHERLRALLAVDHLGEGGLVELDERHPHVEQGQEFLSQYRDYVGGEVLLGGVGVSGELLDPGGAREQVRARERDLDGALGVPLQERDLVLSEPRAQPELVDGYRLLMANAGTSSARSVSSKRARSG